MYIIAKYVCCLKQNKMLTEHCKYSTLTKTVPSRNVSVNIKIGCQELQSIGYVMGKLEELDDTDPWDDPRLRATRGDARRGDLNTHVKRFTSLP